MAGTPRLCTKKQLEKLGRLFVDLERIEEEGLELIVAADFSSGPLLPDSLQQVFVDSVFVVQRASTQEKPVDLNDRQADGLHNTFLGTAGLSEAIRLAGADLVGAEDVRFKFKIFHVLSSKDGFTTHQYFALSGRTREAVVEQHATWIVRWTGGHSVTPKIKWIDVEEFERVVTRGPLFADCTEVVLGHNDCYRDQLLYGVNHWMERMPRKDSAWMGTPGIALGDVNGDGLDDLYFCQEARLPNRLFLRNSDGTLRDVSRLWGEHLRVHSCAGNSNAFALIFRRGEIGLKHTHVRLSC